MMQASNAERSFCASCKCHKKLCISPNLHRAVTVPESFAGAGLMKTEFTLVVCSVVANSSPWPQQVLNKGGLGQQTLLTSQITLKNGDDSVSVKVLWDSGSESSFFHPELLPFATHPIRIQCPYSKSELHTARTTLCTRSCLRKSRDPLKRERSCVLGSVL